MRRAIAFAIALVCAPAARGAWTLIAHTPAAASGGGTITLTTPAINSTGADLLIVTIDNYNQDPALATVTDSRSNTHWAHTTSQFTAGSEANSVIWYAWNAIGGTSHTVTVTVSAGNATFAGMTFSAWSGSKTSANPLDQQNGAKTPSPASTFQAGTVTPSQAGTLVIAEVGSGGSVSSGYSIGGGFTVIDSVAWTSGLAESNASAYLVQGAAAAVNPTWTWTAGNSASAIIASFLPAPSAATGAPRLLTLGVAD
jgi:hypothetical protein